MKNINCFDSKTFLKIRLKLFFKILNPGDFNTKSSNNDNIKIITFSETKNRAILVRLNIEH